MLQRTFSLVAATVVVTVMAVSAYAQPAGTPALWLDANDAATIDDDSGLHPGDIGFNANNIQEWRDKSGSGYVLENSFAGDSDPSWAAGVQNGLPALQFRGSDALQDPTAGLPTNLPHGSDARRTFAAVIPRDNNNVIGYFNYGNPAVSQWHNMLFYDANGDGVSRNYFAGNNNDVGEPNLTKNSGTPYLLELTYDGDSTGEWFTNGTSDVVGTFPKGPLNTQLTDVRVGREKAQTGEVDILELIVYNEKNGTLSAGDRQATGNYLSQKWGIASAYVPEPSTVLLLMLGTTALLFGRRRS